MMRRIERRELGWSASAPATSSSFSYDSHGRISGVEHENLSDVFDEWSFVWDAENNKTSRVDELHGVSQAFTYDSAHRLLESIKTPPSPATAETETYDFAIAAGGEWHYVELDVEAAASKHKEHPGLR